MLITIKCAQQTKINGRKKDKVKKTTPPKKTPNNVNPQSRYKKRHNFIFSIAHKQNVVVAAI